MKRFDVWTLIVLIAVMGSGYVGPGFAQAEDNCPYPEISGASGSYVCENRLVAVWTWTAPAAGTFIFDTEGSDFDTLLLTRQRNSHADDEILAEIETRILTIQLEETLDRTLSQGTPIESEGRISAQQGQRYAIGAIRADGSFARGTIVLNWRPASAGGGDNGGGSRASDDDFASSIAISGASGRSEASNVGASIESGEPNHAGNSGGASVWWTWTAPATGPVTFDTRGSNFDTLLAIYTGTSLNRLTPVASNDDASSGGLQSEVSFTAQHGQTYHIAVDGYGGATGDIVLNWQAAPSDDLSFLEGEPGRRFRDCADCPQMVVVPAGSFMMGSPAGEEGRYDSEGPQHQVTIAEPFAVGVYEATRGEFGRFVSATGRAMGNSCWTYEDGEWDDRQGLNWRHPGFSQSDDHPVVCVTWDDAQAYVRWLSEETGQAYRLLSESEWEYVARAGTRTARYWGESASGQCRHANGADASTGFGWAVSCNDGHAQTSPVGSYTQNDFGLYDVLGNMWERTQDCWHDGYEGAPRDGRAWEGEDGGDCSRRVARGGSWLYSPRLLRAAFRNPITSGDRSISLGFRIARKVTPYPTRPTVALSDLAPDPAQGRVLTMDYSGPEFDVDNLQVYVGATPVEAVVIGDQIHVLLPLTEQGEVVLELDIGSDMAELAIDIEPAPAIAEPDTYVAGVTDDLIADLGVLEGDWGSEIDVLIATKQALMDLEEDELYEVAILLKQNVEPALKLLASPVVAAYDEDACDRAVTNFLKKVTGALTSNIFGKITEEIVKVVKRIPKLAKKFSIVGHIATSAEIVLTIATIPDLLDMSDVCTFTQVTSQTTIMFTEFEKRDFSVTLSERFTHPRRETVLSKAQDVIESLYELKFKLNAGSLTAIFSVPHQKQLITAATKALNEKIANVLLPLEDFANNPDRKKPANHRNFRLTAISDRDIGGFITGETTEDRLVMQFFLDGSGSVPQGGLDFTFTLSLGPTNEERLSFPARLLAAEPGEPTDQANAFFPSETEAGAFIPSEAEANAFIAEASALIPSETEAGAFIPSEAEANAFFPSEATFGEDCGAVRNCTDLYNCYGCTDLHNSYRCTDLHNSYRCTDLHNSYRCIYRCTDLHNSYRCTDLHNSYRCTDLHNSYRCTGSGPAAQACRNERNNIVAECRDKRDDIVKTCRNKRDNIVAECRNKRDECGKKRNNVVAECRDKRDDIVKTCRNKRDDIVAGCRNERDKNVAACRQSQ